MRVAGQHGVIDAIESRLFQVGHHDLVSEDAAENDGETEALGIFLEVRGRLFAGEGDAPARERKCRWVAWLATSRWSTTGSPRTATGR